MLNLDLRQLDDNEISFCEIVLVGELIYILENDCLNKEQENFIENILEKIIY